jgi:hypothetical protein
MKKPSFGMLCRVAAVRNDVSEKRITTIIKVTRIGELGTTLAVAGKQSTLRSAVFSSPILITLMMEAILYSETQFLTRATLRNIPEDVTFQVLLNY